MMALEGIRVLDMTLLQQGPSATTYLAEVDHPIAGRIKMLGLPVRLSQPPGSVRTGAPVLGQHTEEVLLELGYSWEDIGGLKEAGVII